MATIQTTQLEERETGDIKQLRDHDIAEGPVSTNSADATSLKSVPLTLEDGSIIKVRFDSLVTAIGQALGASEDSTITKVLGLNGTVPKGIGMANLASVLGVPGQLGFGIGSTTTWYLDYGEWEIPFSYHLYRPIVFRIEEHGFQGIIFPGWAGSSVVGHFNRISFTSKEGTASIFINQSLGSSVKFEFYCL